MKSTNNSIFIDLNEEIGEYMDNEDIVSYIKWYLDDETDSDIIIKKMKQILFDRDAMDTILYDLEVSYLDFIMVLYRVYPNIMTKHTVKQIREYINET